MSWSTSMWDDSVKCGVSIVYGVNKRVRVKEWFV